MLFKRSKPENEAVRYPGQPRALHGVDAALAVESLGADVVADNAAAGVISRIGGAAASGLRAAAVLDTVDTAQLRAVAGKPAPAVYHLVCRAANRHAGALHGGHDDYIAASDAGMFQMFARGAQQVADYALIARAVAERTLVSGLIAQDVYQTSQSVQAVALPEPELVAEFIGRPDDDIDSPTPGQAVLFGATRRRVPMLLDPDHPVGVGGIQDAEGYFKALAAHRVYATAHVRDAIAEEFERFATLTGRRYADVAGYRVDDADVVVVAQGAVVDELEAAADYVREHAGIKVGVIDLAVFRPFPGPELARLLRGRRAVVAMERCDRPLADALPLTTDVRAAIDRAIENGAAGEEVHAGYGPWRATDRPRVVSAVYGVGTEIPGLAELVAVFQEASAKSPRSMVYVGLGEDATIRRFPHLHSLQQSLNRDYPARNDLALPAADVSVAAPQAHAARLYSLSVQGGLFAGNLFAQSLAEDTGTETRTFAQGGLEANAHTAILTVTHGVTAVVHTRPAVVDTVLVAGGKLVEDVSSRDDLAEGGTLVVETDRDPGTWWKGLSRRTGRWIQDRKLRVVTIDAARIAAETASQPSTIDQLAVWALLGAYASLRLAPEGFDQLVDGIGKRLAANLGAGHYLIADVTGAMRRGANGIADADCSGYSTDDLAAASDGEAPWTVRDAPEWEPTVFDATRFWHSVGYLYDSGQADRALSDPHLATGVVPGASSAFRDMTPYRLRIPNWLAENCTGCGECWSACPDAALPPTIHSVSSLLEASMAGAERAGATLVQMKRFSEHLAKQAYKLLAGDGLNQYLQAGPLFGDAFDRLIDKLGLDEEKQNALRDEFESVRRSADAYPIARTDLFFNDPHNATKGAGMTLSIALNPLACTGCGVCIDVCRDDALDWVEQTPERVAVAGANWNFQAALPTVDQRDVDRFVADAGSEVHRLLDRDAYHTLVGGDGSYPGNASKTAVRLVAAAVESEMTPRYRRHAEHVGELIERLERKIQGDVSEVVRINDFEEFSRRLDHFTDDSVSAERLAGAISEGPDARSLDPERLRRLTSLHKHLVQLKSRYDTGADGHGRARMVMTIDSDAVRLWAGTYPYNPLPYPWICHVPGGGVDTATGAREGIARRIAAEMALCRRAVLELDDAYDPATHDAEFDAFGPGDLDDDERSLIPPVIVLGETGVTSLDDASTLLSSGASVGVVLIDPSGPTPEVEDVESTLIAVSRSHATVTVVQASVGMPGHLLKSVANAVAAGGPMLVRVHAPDPQQNGIAAEKTVAQARVAVESRAYPLFTAKAGHLWLDGNPDREAAWFTRELSFREPSGSESTLKQDATPADWAVGEARFQKHFKVVPKGQIGGAMMPLSEWARADFDTRTAREPYLHFAGTDRRHLVATVSTEMAYLALRRVRLWERLRVVAAAPAPPVEEKRTAEASAVVDPAPPPPAAVPADAQDILAQRLLALSGFSEDPEFFKRSLREFVVQRNEAMTEGEADRG